MPVGSIPFPNLPTIAGIKLGTVGAGIKRANRDDMLVIEIAEGGSCAGVFTKNDFAAAPVQLCKRHLALTNNQCRYLLINSGNANACTGEGGIEDALTLCTAIAKEKGATVEQVLPFSTGVIGERLPLTKMQNALPTALANLNADNWAKAARAIMTTDTVPKGATRQFTCEGKTITVNGIAKGAGMIKPNMATLLAYVATDAPVNRDVLDALLKEAADSSFNRAVIDGDTSTNDSYVLMASSAADITPITDLKSESYRQLRETVLEVSMELAQNIIRDGEGATKFVTINVEAGKSQAECAAVAYAVAQSPLVKTAFFASDPNWGRIVAAIGYAGVESLDTSKISIYLGDVLIVEGGQRAASYREEAGQAVMNEGDITVRIILNRGNVSHWLWTSDLSHDYVKINAEYRT